MLRAAARDTSADTRAGLQRLGGITGRVRRVPVDVSGVEPGGQQPGGRVGFPKAAGQAQARLEEWQRGAGLPLSQKDPGSLI